MTLDQVTAGIAARDLIGLNIHAPRHATDCWHVWTRGRNSGGWQSYMGDDLEETCARALAGGPQLASADDDDDDDIGDLV